MFCGVWFVSMSLKTQHIHFLDLDQENVYVVVWHNAREGELKWLHYQAQAGQMQLAQATKAVRAAHGKIIG